MVGTEVVSVLEKYVVDTTSEFGQVTHKAPQDWVENVDLKWYPMKGTCTELALSAPSNGGINTYVHNNLNGMILSKFVSPTVPGFRAESIIALSAEISFSRSSPYAAPTFNFGMLFAPYTSTNTDGYAAAYIHRDDTQTNVRISHGTTSPDVIWGSNTTHEINTNVGNCLTTGGIKYVIDLVLYIMRSNAGQTFLSVSFAVNKALKLVSQYVQDLTYNNFQTVFHSLSSGWGVFPFFTLETDHSSLQLFTLKLVKS